MFDNVSMQLLAGVILTFAIQVFTILGLHGLGVLNFREEVNTAEEKEEK